MFRSRFSVNEKDEASLMNRLHQDSLDAFIPRFAGVWRFFYLQASRWSRNRKTVPWNFFAEHNGKISRMKKVSLALALAGGFIVPQISRAQFADAVVSYNSGAGFAAGYTNAGAALGAPASGNSITPFAPPFSKTQIVSIGAGGEITLQMSTPILNNPSAPYGVNFILFANQFFIENSSDEVSGLSDHADSILVQVSPDDSTWYTLNQSLAPQPGTLFPTAGNGNPLIPVNSALTLANFEGQNLAGIESLYDGSAGGTGYDLDWATNSLGDNADLASADYVRIEVQTGVLDLDAASVTQAAPDAMSTSLALMLVGAGLFWLYRRNDKAGKNFADHGWKIRAGLALAGFLAASSGESATLTENFSTNPLQNGWRIFGDTNLFQWDATNQNLEVTWDSSQSNSYFYHPLGTILTRNDDFTLAFDLQLNEAEASGYGFELAIGFLNLAEAASTNFQRSTGENSPDLVEFDYFPDVGYGATVWPLFVDTNSLFNYNGPSDYAIYAPNLGDWYHIVMTYTASNQAMVTTMTDFDQTTNITIVDPLDESFTDFRVNTISVSSYQDDGLGDSIYAQGVIDNIVITMPPPPVLNLTGTLSNGVWQAQFCSQSNWLYVLERTANFQCWTNVSPETPGSGTNLFLQDPNPPPVGAFYRVSASRP
jgi:hypothetical protein